MKIDERLPCAVGSFSVDTTPVLIDQRLKRCCDLVAAALLLVVLTPLMLFVGALVRLTSRGPALFRQVRVGQGEKPFVIYKFRTMTDSCSDEIHQRYVTSLLTDTDPPSGANGLYKLTDDPRVTSLGKWLRKSSVDELPQLFNVLKGEMSLVGPRPILPFEADLLSQEQRLRFTVRPGITGLWQVSGRNRLGFAEELALDVRYAREHSPLVDFMILVRTLPAVLSGGTQ